ncbi:MAG: hypothetical protein PUC23_01875 [bacterium]|nr:hypothetical protein [bacterium]
MKKVFNIIGAICLTIFSFYYTDKMVELSKSKDSIMQDIMSFKEGYEKESIDAKIINDYVIPGIKGKKVDIDKSYNKMKELGYYNENLYIYTSEKPNISIDDFYNKFIIGGNPKKNNVSLVFNLVDNKNLNTILYVLKEQDVVANFFIDGKYFINDLTSLQSIADNNHFIGNLGYDGKYLKTTIKNTNALIRKFVTYENDFCYLDEINYDALDICSNLKMYTVKGTTISNTTPYLDIKEKLISGGIYKLDTNNYTVEELGIIIKYIKQKGYNIVSLEELISEENN